MFFVVIQKLLFKNVVRDVFDLISRVYAEHSRKDT